MNIQMSGNQNVSVNQREKKITINGVIYLFPKGMKGNNITTINGKTYIDGFELVNGKWKRTFKGFIHQFF